MNINFNSKALKSTSLALVIGACILVPSISSAQSLCDEGIVQEADRQSQEELVRELEHLEEVYGKYMEQPDWLGKSDGLLAGCSNANWPDWANNIFNFPVLSKLKDGVGQVKSACDQARSQIGKAAAQYENAVGVYQDGVARASSRNPNGGLVTGAPRNQGGILDGLWGQQPSNGLNIPSGNNNGTDWSFIDDIVNGGRRTIPNIPGISGPNTGNNPPGNPSGNGSNQGSRNTIPGVGPSNGAIQ